MGFMLGQNERDERAVLRLAVSCLVKAGHSVTVSDGLGFMVWRSRRVRAVLRSVYRDAALPGDAPELIVFTGPDGDHRFHSSVPLSLGREGGNILANIPKNLRETLAPAVAMAAHIAMARGGELEAAR